MATKEWAVPVGLGLAVFGLLWFVHPAPAHAPPGEGAMIVPFDAVTVVPTPIGNGSSELLLGIWREPVPVVGGTWLMGRLTMTSAQGREGLPILQKSPLVVELPAGLREGSHGATLLLDNESLVQLLVAGPGPRFGMDGYNATRVTAYIFDEHGVLVASNADASNRSRFADGGDAQDLPDTVWYLGANESAPAGTEVLPAWGQAIASRLVPSLQGQPVGGVATTSSNALVALYGTLFITVQVDELVQAP